MDIDAYLADRASHQRLSGSVFVRQHGQVLHDRAYALADRATGRANTPETAYQIASNSKQFAAAASLLLSDQGKLAPHDRIATRMPDCPALWQSITIHHLLTHTSGIGHWRDYPDLSLYEPKTRADLLSIFARRPLSFPPGGGWAYSSPAYVLLAHIVEHVSGQPYAAFLRERIFDPLGMASTGAGNHAPQPERQALGYEGAKPLPSFDLDTVSIGAGDIWSTTHDLARWHTALAAPGPLLRPASWQAMFTPFALTAPGFLDEIPGTHYGYGWCLAELHGQRLRFHAGDNAGFVSVNIVLPDGDGALIVLCNDENSDLTGIGLRLLDALLTSR